jgi:hypothetical protein
METNTGALSNEYINSRSSVCKKRTPKGVSTEEFLVEKTALFWDVMTCNLMFTDALERSVAVIIIL